MEDTTFPNVEQKHDGTRTMVGIDQSHCDSLSTADNGYRCVHAERMKVFLIHTEFVMDEVGCRERAIDHAGIPALGDATVVIRVEMCQEVVLSQRAGEKWKRRCLSSGMSQACGTGITTDEMAAFALQWLKRIR